MPRRTTPRHHAIEGLEPRQLLSGSPLSVRAVWVEGSGSRLQIQGGNKSDAIVVSLVNNRLTVSNGAWSTPTRGTFTSIVVQGGRGNDVIMIDSAITLPTTLSGGLGDDTISGGSGDDALYGQGGSDVLLGNAGNDTLVNIGDSVFDQSTGGDGFDAFWSDTAATERVTDASADEMAGGALHTVGNFYGYSTMRKGRARTAPMSLDLNGGDLPDPSVCTQDTATVGYVNFSNRPLFAAGGPTTDDVVQGYVGDCWYLSTLGAIARTNPNAIRQAVVSLGDGTYAVQFDDGNGGRAFVRVDADLPAGSWGGMAYASLGAQDSLWVAIMEKAYACFRGAAYGYADAPASYDRIDGGWMDEAFGDLGYASDMHWDGEYDTADPLLDRIAAELADGKAVTLASKWDADDATLIAAHAYTVVAVQTNGDGTRTLVLRNPWGIDGCGHDGVDDSYLHLTGQEALDNFWAVISADVG